jgi:hypothetical protein
MGKTNQDPTIHPTPAGLTISACWCGQRAHLWSGSINYGPVRWFVLCRDGHRTWEFYDKPEEAIERWNQEMVKLAKDD